MREFVLNDACLGGTMTLEEAATLAIDVEIGLVALIAAGHGVQSMRLAASTGEVHVAAGVTLADVLQHILRGTKSGRVLARMATKYPVEDDLDEGEFAALVEWAIPAHPNSISLVLCARSGRIAATITTDDDWRVDPLTLLVARDPADPGATAGIEVDNVFSAENAAELVKRLDEAFVAVAKPADIWRDRAQLFPDLDFAQRVERDLADLGPVQYSAAIARLQELNLASDTTAFL